METARRVEWKDIEAGSPAALAAVAEEFGKGGILAVAGVPGMPQARDDFYRLCGSYATSRGDAPGPDSTTTGFGPGWNPGQRKSTGKFEAFVSSFRADYVREEGDPRFGGANKWPVEGTDACPVGFRDCLLRSSRLLHSVGLSVARVVDAVVAQRATEVGMAAPLRLADLITRSTHHSSRFLYYPPVERDVEIPEGRMWCDMHFDIALITATFSGASVQPGEAPKEDVGCQCLNVAQPHGTIVPTVIPPDCVGIFLAEHAHLLIGGLLKASVHGVPAPRASEGGRLSLISFIHAPWDTPMAPPEGAPADVWGDEFRYAVTPLRERLTAGDTFGEWYDHVVGGMKGKSEAKAYENV